jgi:hypothetical protein
MDAAGTKSSVGAHLMSMGSSYSVLAIGKIRKERFFLPTQFYAFHTAMIVDRIL